MSDKPDDQIIDQTIDLNSLTPSSRLLTDASSGSSRKPLIRPQPTIFEYIVDNLRGIVLIAIIILMALFIFGNNIFNNILGSSVPQTSTLDSRLVGQSQ
jgi:hypothetical protein